MKKPNQPKPMSVAEKLQKLKLFNEKVDVVRRGRFFQQVSPEHSVKIHFGQNEPLKIEKRGADEEAVLALAITLRFFVQPGDGIMLKQIADIYDSLPVEDMAKQSAR